MTAHFLFTVNADTAHPLNRNSHAAFRRLCALMDGHGIPATWLLDEKSMAGAVAGIAAEPESDGTNLVAAINSMATPQDMVFVARPAPAARDDDFKLPGMRHVVTLGQLRHVATGYAQLIKIRRGFRRAVRTGCDFHLVLETGLLDPTGRSCEFLEDILFFIAEHRAGGRVTFATVGKMAATAAGAREAAA
jgi:hypothetical protein